jgi:hypothetical protein
MGFVATGKASTVNDGFSPRMLVRVGSSPLVFVLGYATCTHKQCLELLRTDNNGTSFTNVSAPPVVDIKYSIAGTLDQLVFANAQDGYALVGANGGEGVNDGTELYATFNGARTWTREPLPAGDNLSRVAVSSDTLYGVTMHCATPSNGNERCTNYLLVHSSLAVTKWSSAALPNGDAFPSGGYVGNVAAFGSNVWLTEGAKWSLLVSSRNHGTLFTTFTPTFPALASIARCDLTAVSNSSLWASCPTGMQVSFAYTSDAGAKWTDVPTKQFSGTGGGYFDPVSSSLAYLDYGGPRSLYRVNDSGRVMTKVETLQCSKVNSSVGALVFTAAHSGLAICTPDGLWSRARLEQTTNGGTTWRRVVP